MGKYLHAGVGTSKAEDPKEAGKECVRTAFEKLKEDGGKKPNFAIVFCSGGKYGKDDKTIEKFVKSVDEALRELNPEIKWVGCTTAGEISNYGASEKSSVAMLLESEYVDIGIGIGKNVSNDPIKAGERGIEEALSDLNMSLRKSKKYVKAYIKFLAERDLTPHELTKIKPYLVLVLCNGFTAKREGFEDEIIEGIQNVVGNKIPIVGGSAGDDFNLRENYIFANGIFYTDSTICCIIHTDLKFSYNFIHPYEPTEKYAVVTKSKEYVVEELDGKPAFDRFAELIGKAKNEIVTPISKLQKLPFSDKLITVMRKLGIDTLKYIPLIEIGCVTPFGMVDPKGRYCLRVVRDIVGNSLMFTERVPKNVLLTLMSVEKSKMVKKEMNLFEKLLQGKKGGIMMLFSCALFNWFREKEGIKEIYEKELRKMFSFPFIGFYGYGELCDGRHTLTTVVVHFQDEIITLPEKRNETKRI